MTLRRAAVALVAVVLSLAALTILRAAPDQDFAEQLPRIPPLSPADALKAIQTRPGFHVELVAAAVAKAICDRAVAIELPEARAWLVSSIN